MKRNIILIAVLVFIFGIAITSHAQQFKWPDAGKVRARIYEASGIGSAYDWSWENGLYYGFGGIATRSGCGVYCKDFAVLDYIYGGDSSVYEYWYAGIGIWGKNDLVTFPVEGSDGIAVRKFYRYAPATITVDGIEISPGLRKGDSVNSSVIPGTADQMIVSHTRTSMGIDIYLKTLSWGQRENDDYLVYDITLVNTGNIDQDADIELPVSTLDSVMFSRDLFFAEGQPWLSAYGEYTYDSLRIPTYAYNCWISTTEDDWGFPHPDIHNLRRPCFYGEAVLHVDSDWHNNEAVTNDPAQPQMTCPSNSDWRISPWVGNYPIREEGRKRFYRTLYGFTDALTTVGVDHNWSSPYLTTDQYPNTHHTERMELWLDPAYHTDLSDRFYNPGWGNQNGAYSFGPWMNVQVGDSMRIVIAPVAGSMTRKMSYILGRAWYEGVADTLWGGAPYKLPPQMISHPELSPTDNDRAKDSYIEAGRDSLFHHTFMAQANFDAGYNIATPPPSPNLEITSQPNRIIIEWDNRSEVEDPTCNGYILYRARGATEYEITDQDVERGDWQPMFQCGGTDPGGIDYSNTIVYEYDDSSAIRGFSYYYAVTAFNATGGESELYNNQTSGSYGAASLTRAPGERLEDIRVVPNPYNINARLNQFDEENKIMFYNLPPQCTIKIFNESLDLIKTIEHTDESGDEPWLDPLRDENSYMNTSSQQYPASGLYIAHIETLAGESIDKIFYIVR